MNRTHKEDEVMVLKIKISTRGGKIKPYVAQVSTNGKAQQAFAAQARACGARKGMPKSEIPEVGKCLKGKTWSAK